MGFNDFMRKGLEKLVLVLTDFIAVNSTLFIWGKLRQSMGFFSQTTFWGFINILIFISVFWFILLVFFGHYRINFTRSRTDEFISILKTVTIGVFLIFVLTLIF